MAKRRPAGDERKVSQLWYTPEQYALVQAAAKADKRSMVNFATKAAVEAARKLLDECARINKQTREDFLARMNGGKG